MEQLTLTASTLTSRGLLIYRTLAVVTDIRI